MAGKLRLENLQVQLAAEPVATPEAGDMKEVQAVKELELVRIAADTIDCYGVSLTAKRVKELNKKQADEIARRQTQGCCDIPSAKVVST